MEQVFLSNTELYFVSQKNISNATAIMDGDEAKHLLRVMRATVGDEINITDGDGNIYKTEIICSDKRSATLEIKEIMTYENKMKNIWFCLPRLKNADRFEFALEKCIELGITNFVVFESKRAVGKGAKIDRWNKIAQAAMKQSLRAFQPKILFERDLKKITEFEGRKYVFEQNSKVTLSSLISEGEIDSNEPTYFIFGPEGGLTEEEVNLFTKDNPSLLLTKNRLRSETAIVSAASLLSVE